MCGIGGILRTDGQPIPEEWLDAIDARIKWRGPDGHGRFRDRVEIEDANAPNGKRIVEVAFVHRRLSIIDHKDGAQPMVSERGRNDSEGLVAVVFNGCIYNHRELRKELEGKGHTFVTDHSDTEVLIHGWREWQTDLPKQLEGMYAFAIWDRFKATLILARDLYGEKPLYIRATDTCETGAQTLSEPLTAFASEASCLFTMPAPAVIAGDFCRMQWLTPFLFVGYPNGGFVPGPDLIDVYEVSPGNVEHRQAQQPERDWQSFGDSDSFRTYDGMDIEKLIDQAVSRRLHADVPLGCFLSGGVDSSLIALAAKRHKADLLTFNVRMPDPRYDESAFAKAVAQQLGTRHQTIEVSSKPAEDLVTLISTLGQPFGDSSILPTYWVSKAVREHVKVALSGDGGDELFIGYERYSGARILVRWRTLLSILPLRKLHAAHPKSRLAKLARIGDMARDYPDIGLIATEAIFTLQQLRELAPAIIDPRWRCSIDEDHNVEHDLAGVGALLADQPGDDALELLRSEDIDNYLPNDLLRKVDTASMAAGLEVRCPFLDRDLARAALSLPIDQLMPGGQRKGLLRNIARKYLPKEIVDRPKMGFAIPIGEWFRNDDLPHKGSGMKTLLLDHLNSSEPFGPISLSRKAVQKFIDEHMSCKRDHGQRLFTLLTLSIWARQIKRTQSPSS